MVIVDLLEYDLSCCDSESEFSDSDDPEELLLCFLCFFLDLDLDFLLFLLLDLWLFRFFSFLCLDFLLDLSFFDFFFSTQSSSLSEVAELDELTDFFFEAEEIFKSGFEGPKVRLEFFSSESLLKKSLADILSFDLKCFWKKTIVIINHVIIEILWDFTSTVPLYK